MFARGPRLAAKLVFSGLENEDLAGGRGAGGILARDIARVKDRILRQVRGSGREIYERRQNGSGLRPLGGGCAAAAMVLTAVAVIDGLQRGFRGFRSRRLCRRMMAGHGRRRRMCGLAYAAAHGCRLSALRRRQRSEGRGEYDQQQKSSGPARSSPHLRDSIAENQFSVATPC